MGIRTKQSLVIRVLVCGVLTFGVLALTCQAQRVKSSAVKVSIVADEADAVLGLLAKKRGGQEITDADWQAIFSSEGYTRLKKRELAMGRTFAEEDFKTFALSDALSARAQTLAETLARWRRADVA